MRMQLILFMDMVLSVFMKDFLVTSTKLDEIDLRILRELGKDGRMTAAEHDNHAAKISVYIRFWED